MMRTTMAAILLLAWTGTASAELYRWRDPESGSIKYSNFPPPWYGEGAKGKRGPSVEVIGGERPPPRSEAKGVQTTGDRLLEQLDTKRKELLRAFTALPTESDFATAGAGLGQQLKAYEAVTAEMDRLDPKRAAARQAEETGLLEKLSAGLRQQFAPPPVVPGKPLK